MNTGLEGIGITCLAFADRSGDALIAGTQGASCWAWAINTGIADGGRRVVNDGLLVIPNPCRASRSLRISLPRTLDPSFPLSLSLFDLSGRVVLRRTLGPRTSSLDVSSLPAGVYRLEVGSGPIRAATQLVVLDR
jgi:hypothetical protein